MEWQLAGLADAQARREPPRRGRDREQQLRGEEEQPRLADARPAETTLRRQFLAQGALQHLAVGVARQCVGANSEGLGRFVVGQALEEEGTQALASDG